MLAYLLLPKTTKVHAAFPQNYSSHFYSFNLKSHIAPKEYFPSYFWQYFNIFSSSQNLLFYSFFQLFAGVLIQKTWFVNDHDLKGGLQVLCKYKYSIIMECQISVVNNVVLPGTHWSTLVMRINSCCLSSLNYECTIFSESNKQNIFRE